MAISRKLLLARYLPEEMQFLLILHSCIDHCAECGTESSTKDQSPRGTTFFCLLMMGNRQLSFVDLEINCAFTQPQRRARIFLPQKWGVPCFIWRHTMSLGLQRARRAHRRKKGFGNMERTRESCFFARERAQYYSTSALKCSRKMLFGQIPKSW
jgi:hypothetical protein